MLVDLNARYKNRPENFELQTFYGQLTHIYWVNFPDPGAVLDDDEPATYILAAIRNCVLKADDPELAGLDVHFIARTGTLDLIDITSVQSLVGRVQDISSDWAIIDRSGALARGERK